MCQGSFIYYVKSDGQENINVFTHKIFVYLDLGVQYMGAGSKFPKS